MPSNGEREPGPNSTSPNCRKSFNGALMNGIFGCQSTNMKIKISIKLLKLSESNHISAGYHLKTTLQISAKKIEFFNAEKKIDLFNFRIKSYTRQHKIF